MNTSVKITSKIIAIILPVTSIVAIIYTLVFTIEDYTDLKDATDVEFFGPLLFLLAWPFVAGLVIARIIAIVIIIKEMILKEKRAEMAVKIALYQMDWKFTLKGIFGVIISGFILGGLIVLAVGTCDDYLRAMLGTLFICTFTYALKGYNNWLACLEEDDETGDIDDEDEDE